MTSAAHVALHAPHAPQAHGSPVALGDVQGCLDALLALVSAIDADAQAEARAKAQAKAQHEAAGGGRPAPTLWLVGDLVNRGPKSLETLRWAIANESRIVMVLGNHDLHLLAVAAGIRPVHRSDTFGEILRAPDAPELIDWLRRRPLAHLDGERLLVHAGVLPQWSAASARSLAAEVERELSGPRWVAFLRTMYGNQPQRWDDALRGPDRLRVIVNAFTRLRFCTAQGSMDFSEKGEVHRAPPGHLPWFEVPGRASADATVVFGHWSRLGLLDRPDLLALDTGCVWGGALTAVRLDDRKRYAVACG